MRLFAREYAEVVTALLPSVAVALSRREQGREVAERPTGRHHAIAGCGHAEHACHPLQRAEFHGRLHGAHLVDGHAVVEQSTDRFEQGQHRQRRGHLVPHVARVVQVIALGQQALHPVDGVVPAAAVEFGYRSQALIGRR